MTATEIIQALGGVTAVARLLGIKPPSVHSWMVDGIPESRLIALAGQIELKTEGRFSRRERWPDKYGIFWPELATPQPTTEPAAAAMVPLLQSGLEKAEQALADEPTDRVARLIKRNRTQALAEIAATPQPTTEPAAAGV